MRSIGQTFNNMVANGHPMFEKTAQQVAPVSNEVREELLKYAEAAQEMLLSNFTETTPDQVEKLASYLIEQDALLEEQAELEQQEKVAELYEGGQIAAEGFKAALGDFFEGWLDRFSGR